MNSLLSAADFSSPGGVSGTAERRLQLTRQENWHIARFWKLENTSFKISTVDIILSSDPIKESKLG